MPPAPVPPFQIIASGLAPQGLSVAQRAPQVVGGVLINIDTGGWQLTVNDPTVEYGNCALILSPGSGSNLAEGVSFGQSQQAAGVFIWNTYRNDTGAKIDVESQFIVVKWPNAEEGS